MNYFTAITFLLIPLFCEFTVSNPVDTLVVTTTESLKEANNETKDIDNITNPKIYSMNIHTNISNRFATTLITSKVKNLKKVAAETTFSILLPENAFVSEFVMEIDDKEYKAYVKEKEEAKKIYEDAVASGRGAAHVELSARDSKTFTVSVNIEPESKTLFRLTYEELLQRQLGRYELVVNINPGQIVEDLSVEVHINESRPLIFVETPSLRTGNEVSKNDENLKPSAEIDILNSTSATVKFKLDKDQQKHFAGLLGSNKEDGFAGQFVVQYDVERDPQGGEVLIRDGYFVHFFSPSELEPLPKHVVFVLDHSGSMSGRKIEQLIEAMQNILSELNTNDMLNIVRFSDSASVWNITENMFSSLNLINKNYENLEPELREYNIPEAVEATEENIKKAKEAVKNRDDLGMTNIIEGLEVGLFLIKKNQEKFPKKYQPMLIFLTDGQPNVGMYSKDDIINTVTKLNSNSPENKTTIFSLSFGAGANKEFLQKLSLKNSGFSKHIYEASDASLQLQDFYRKISSPLLSNVTFKYVGGVTDVTKAHYPLLFNGSELVVAGRLDDSSEVILHVDGLCKTGPIKFTPVKEEPVSSIERLWAYLTVQQLLKDKETTSNNTDITKKALDLSLKYSFVTSVTSLVVVKPNKTDSVDENRSNKISESDGYIPTSSYQGRSLTAKRIRPKARFDTSSSIVGRRAFHRTLASTAPFNRRRTTPTAASTSVVTEIPPKWLQDLINNDQNITTPQGIFKLGKSGEITLHPNCTNNTPSNIIGKCTLLADCPQLYPVLTDVNVYMKYFCPLKEFAGICCPKSTNGNK